MATLTATPSPSSKFTSPHTSKELGGGKKENVRMDYSFVGAACPQQSTMDLKCPSCSINLFILSSSENHVEVCHPSTATKAEVAKSYLSSAQLPRDDASFATKIPQDLHVPNATPQNNSMDGSFVRKKKKAKPKGGFNGVFYHSATCLPIHPQEGGEQVDSEGELDPEWLKVQTRQLIDDFFDVNEGEKEVMKMWNLHVMHDNYVGDCHIPLACTRFVERYGHQIIQKNLYRNFILHLTNLVDFELLPVPDFHATVQSLHSQMQQNSSVQLLKDFWTKTPETPPTSLSSSQSTPSAECQDGEACDTGKRRSSKRKRL